MTAESSRTWFWVLLAVVLHGCVTGSPPSTDSPVAPDASRELAILISQPLAVAESPRLPELDIGVLLFDPGVAPDDASPAAAVRRLESKLLAGQLRDTLVASNQWGAVRLLPERSPLVPITIETRIVHSDGRDLILDVGAKDALEDTWFRRRLVHSPKAGLESSNGLGELFNGVSNMLSDSWAARSAGQRESLLAAADVRYAQQLAPQAFDGYLVYDQGQLTLNRLPAQDDPMLRRVARIKNQEYLFCDTIDEQYVELAERTGPTYELWRQAAVEQAEWLERYEARVASRGANAGDGAFARMQASYAAYRSYRIQEQALTELAEALDSESRPMVINAVDRAVTLEGTLEAQYATWRRLLKEIYALEQGDAP